MFKQLPGDVTEAQVIVAERRRELSVPSPDGEVIPDNLIDMLSTLPVNYIYLPPPRRDDPRDVFDKELLERLDKYIVGCLRNVSYYRDDVDPMASETAADEDMILDLPEPTMAMMVSVPYDLTKEEVVGCLEKMRDNKRAFAKGGSV